VNRHLRIFEFALSTLARSWAKTSAVVVVYSLLVGLAASLLLYVKALGEEARLVLAGAPELIVQRLQGGRHVLVPVSRAEEIRRIRGVGTVTPRVWGYYYDPPTSATLTFWGAESVPADALDFSTGELGGEPSTCVLGQGVADVRFLDVGGRLPIRRHDGTLVAPRVVGVFTADSALLTHDLVVIPTAELRRIFGIADELATDLAVEVTNPREVETVARKVREAWPDARTISRRRILDTYDAVFDWRAGLWAAILGCVGAAFAVLVWNQASALSAEEYRTLGILKAVGWSPRNILEWKLWEGTIVSAVSVLTGLLVAEIHLIWLDGALFTRILKGWSVLFPPFDTAPSLDAYTLLPGLLLAVAPYVAASLVPAWRAAVTDPDSVMRS